MFIIETEGPLGPRYYIEMVSAGTRVRWGDRNKAHHFTDKIDAEEKAQLIGREAVPA